ncbi:MAG: Calx-beta domain-containing protein, partial [Candidatus Poseidoniia archaeon]
TVVVTLAAPGNATLGFLTSHATTITDNDLPPVVQFDVAVSTVDESAGVVAVSLSLDAPSGLDIEVPFTVGGTAVDPDDYTVSGTPLLIPAGSVSTNLFLTVVDDSIDELLETVILTLGTPVNAALGVNGVHAVRVNDNDLPPVVQFDLAGSTVLESAGSHVFSISLDAVSGLDVTLPFTVGGTAIDPADFGIDASPLVISAGAQSVLVNLSLVDDLLDELDETVVVTLGVPGNATLGPLTSHTITIMDNDLPPVVQFDLASSTVLEGAGSHVFSISLDAVSGLDVTVPFTVGGTAVDPADFGIDASPVVIPAGAQSALVNLSLIDDLLDELDETVMVALGVPGNATLGPLTSHTTTITDNDLPPVVQFDLAGSTVLESAGSHVFSITLDAVSGLDVTLPFTVGGTAIDPADFGI